jgi:hypothetical protein
VNNGNFYLTPCYTQGNTVIVSNVVQTSTVIRNLVLRVGNILNPSPAITTDNFFGTIGNDSSGFYGNGNYDNFITLSPGKFTSC